VLIVFDCKRHSRPVEVSDVAAFADQRADVGASLAVIVSNSGFADGAVEIAASHRIMLQTLKQAQAADWQDLLGGNAWANLHRVQVRDLRCAYGADGDFSPMANPVLYGRDSQVNLNLNDHFVDAWNNLPVPRPLGHVVFDVDFTDDEHFATRAQKAAVKTVRLSGSLVAHAWIVNLNLAEGEILRDEPDGAKVYERMTSESFEWQHIMDEEPGVEIDERELARLESSTLLNARLDGANRYLRVVVSKTSKKPAE
jgi:Restriction endonuclease